MKQTWAERLIGNQETIDRLTGEQSGFQMTTAEAYFNGDVEADEFFYWSKDLFEYGVYPFVEIEDVLLQRGENGEVTLCFSRTNQTVPADWPIYFR